MVPFGPPRLSLRTPLLLLLLLLPKTSLLMIFLYVFEGDLAHIAAFHLKVNDRVYIAGKLSASLPHLSYNQFQASVQVIVHDLNFVEETVQTKKSSMICVPEKGTSFIEEIEKGTLNDYDNVKKKLDSFLGPWSDLIDNPKEWWDCRDKKLNGLVSRKYPDFKRKDDKKALWLDRAPKEVLKKISALEFDVSSQNSNEVKQFGDSVKKDVDSAINSWNNLVDNPKQWWDYRNCKHNGLVNPKYPDFKHKDGSQSLWLSSAPLWLSSKLKSLEFDVPIPKSKEVNGNKGDEMWKDLLENPNKWWDNRVDKKSERAPDFKHKETGEGLWLSSSPIWVQSKLQPPQTKSTPDVGHVANGTRGTFANAYLES
ncbi:protein OSB3, chloroplastic/mitochondrial-like isoform X3 [Humulus lupulus]|uniref:protein OSB3, chloroplastic/mitochondrial-like isoform X3 n=1 Tax=Humulus lupulus TaxID=3486 RepID=UPI002B40DAD2|nr:protein OSB3, chloroplastic/mitochondrial-like isoform X3 [Humulus lupulus]